MKQTAVEYFVSKLIYFDITKEEDYDIFCELEIEAKEMEKQQKGYSEEEVTILLINIINEIEIRKQGIISKLETMPAHLLEGGCMAFESSQDVVKEQLKEIFKNK